MSTLIEQIAKVYSWECTKDELTSDQVADKILSLPSGLEVVRECRHPEGSYEKDSGWYCDDCQSTGEIIRDMTIQEAMEFLQNETAAGTFGTLQVKK